MSITALLDDEPIPRYYLGGHDCGPVAAVHGFPWCLCAVWWDALAAGALLALFLSAPLLLFNLV